MATTRVKVDVLNLEIFVEFLHAIQEIAGTANDPDTAANLRAAIQKLNDGNIR